MVRHRLTDKQWNRIKDLFPKRRGRGRPASDPRRIVDAILWILRTGAPWRDLPKEFGAWQTVWCLFDKWNADGTLNAILNRLRSEVEIDTELWCVDGTIVRAARCASGGGKKGTPMSLRTTRWAALVAV